MRRVARLVVELAVIAALGLVVGGWYYSTQLLAPADEAVVGRDVEVVATSSDTLTLRPDDAPDWAVEDLRGDLVVGFDTAGGYVRLSGPPVAIDGDEVERTGELVAGTRPTIGDRGTMDVAAWPHDPTATGLPVEQVVADGPLGDLPGWVFPGRGERADDWVVYVHGRGGSRAAALRTVPTVVDRLGRSALVVTHRNDAGAPASPDGFGHFGDAEWRDLEAWLGWLSEQRTVDTVTLYGFSQGGSVVASCLRRCDDTADVTGLVLDSPLLSMDATLQLQATERGIPAPVVDPLLVSTRVVTSLRGGPDLGNLEHVDALATMDRPILAFHGDADHTVPPGPTTELGRLDPDQVTVVTHAGDHVRGWNVDPDAYERELVAFLDG